MKKNAVSSSIKSARIRKREFLRSILMKAGSLMICREFTVARPSVNDVPVSVTGGPGGRTNAVGAMSGKDPPTVTLFDGAVSSDVFYAWIRQDLLPKPPERGVVVTDNAAFHKRRDIRGAAESAGHILEYLPVYSPDLNPVEHKRAQAEALQRKHRCSVDELFRDHKL